MVSLGVKHCIDTFFYIRIRTEKKLKLLGITGLLNQGKKKKDMAHRLLYKQWSFLFGGSQIRQKGGDHSAI